jgi:hypothetical protein
VDVENSWKVLAMLLGEVMVARRTEDNGDGVG